ncbi:hypothetical protein RhiirA5_431992 [Rhizophagus irregularis]|uniref:DUF659 domain-containing protein n=1 Tax=Rhizophagus irregularis TaxID=588596 RepID=A0A2N0NU15_9GLOM|nr:hypothetical protein RhiirA5_431992 [Rhizophagus irregularis]
MSAFDGWTSPAHMPIWNFVIMTPSREEYLFKLQYLSDYSHIDNYIAESAVVLDNASNYSVFTEEECKTRWTTASESVDSIIRLEPVLEQIATNNSNLLNNKALAETNDDDDECDVLLNESLPNQITVPLDNYDGNNEEQGSDGRGNYDYNVKELLDDFINEDVKDYEDE